MNIEELKKQLDEVIERLEKVEDQLKVKPMSSADFRKIVVKNIGFWQRDPRCDIGCTEDPEVCKTCEYRGGVPVSELWPGYKETDEKASDI